MVKSEKNDKAKKWTQLLKVIPLLLVMGLFLTACGSEKPEDDTPTPVVPTQTAVSTPASPTEEATRREAIPEIAGEITVITTDSVNVTTLAETDLATAGIAPLPQMITLQSNIYLVDSNDTAVSGQVALNLPADANPQLLDLYGWNGDAWEFIPSTYDGTTQQRTSPEQPLYPAVALVAAEASNPMRLATDWAEEPISANISDLSVGTLTFSATDTLDGDLSPLPEGNYASYLRVTNEQDRPILTSFLADSTAQEAQIETLVDTAVSGNYTGVNLDYQNVADSQKEAFSTFIQTLGDALHSADKRLIVTLNLTSAEQAWATIGKVADTVYLRLPHDPERDLDPLIVAATSQIDRRKLMLLTSASAVARSGETFTELSDEQAFAPFGQLQFTDETSEVGTGTAVTATLSSNVTDLQWDEQASTYRYSTEDENGDTYTVWLANPTAVADRLQTAVPHNLNGVALQNVAQVSNPTDFVAALENLSDGKTPPPPEAPFVWTILDEEGNILATENSDESSFTWAGSDDPGSYTVTAALALSADMSAPLDSSDLLVTATDGVEVAENSDDATQIEGVINLNANIRIGPGINYDAYPGGLPKDTAVEILGRSEDELWIQIRFSNADGWQKGWIYVPFIDFDPDLEVADLNIVDEVADAPVEDVVANTPATEPPATAVPPPASSGPPPPFSAAPVVAGGFELGGQTHSFSNPALMSSAGMNWVKFQHKWGPGGNPNDLAGRIGNARAAGFKVLLSIPGANTYPDEINFAEYVQFLAGVAALGPDAIEVWNEMNIDFEWPAGEISPSSYVNNMLAPAYNAIKAANPNVMVISGAPAPTGFDNDVNAWADNRYVAGMIAAGASNYLDCVGAHYNAGASSPSTTVGHPSGSAHYSWYLLPTLNVYAQLGKPVCFTELGYLSGEDYGGVPDRFGWAANTTVDQHAAWLAEAVSVAANTGRVRLIIVFNVDFTQWGDDPQAGYAMIRKNGGCPACETLGRVMGR